ncbi:hypoxanthine phosphoribosyltransferase [Algoriphagus zhangzhouensis]|uniref:Hypoxanthine phosphoribosyltransferase n=1 Tax=Algoriphagus zhangzhouensis TaxID=1073327 RepID=A0A1M7ZIG5_9BACT|nr:hypoxanthine phosphoribosyltransferase [Algoriphagus zhangzhouensis]TDY43789.1 hypoxanthine phosphoribosyltransferase [Algoriphagus zhangzhouensis]SHO64667.1 hypoxanthine phosphoribosyltransferase [Algoriphagus zhangzhouensis]
MLVTLKDKTFEIYLKESEIKDRLKTIGQQISIDFKGQDLLVLGVLNGSFIVMADLCREIKGVSVQTTFLKISSYSGTESTGIVKEVIGLPKDLQDKNILIVEDIVDTGVSMNYLLHRLENEKPKSISIATLLYKPEAFRFNYQLHYVGFEIPNKFVVGYGLDYDGLGRELPEIYQLK